MNRQSIVFGLVLASCASIPNAYAGPIDSGLGTDLALGADTSASDEGWGGGTSKSDLVDGKASYYDTWMHGLAAPWGWGGQYFQVVVDFASDTTFNTVVAWWHRGERDAPNFVDIQIWNAVSSAWDTVFSTTNAFSTVGTYDDPTTWTSSPTAPFIFPTVTADKLRLVYDNQEIYNRSGYHGWLHEVGVYNVSAIPEPATLVLTMLGLAGLGCVRSRKT
ncbi:MAG: PEP-CTERM sorting domain-containing protein [Candidatus Accumulibacter propinquus]|jgi:hypothetical protein|uniref:PEP-CTERM sorting domain-containing protein n=1 Tax=Candidatus Accumulibacter propinquus TaxID=2954380 RepID=UPI002FC37991